MGLISRVSSRTYRKNIMSQNVKLKTATNNKKRKISVASDPSKNVPKIKKSSEIPYKSTVIDIFLKSDKLELNITTIKTEAEKRRQHEEDYDDTALMIAVKNMVDDQVLIKLKKGIFRFNKSRFLKILTIL